jgi:hypothetical protein
MSIPVLWLSGNAELYALALTSLISALVLVLLLYLACCAALPDTLWWVWLLGPSFLLLNIPVQWAKEMKTLPAFEQLYRRIDVQLDPDDEVALYVLRQTVDTP